MSQHESPHKLNPGEDYQYPIKASGEASKNLDFRKSLNMKDVLYFPRLKKNILSISALDAKGISFAFVDDQFLMSPRGKIIEDAPLIIEEDEMIVQIEGTY